jgi:DNA-binding SARP family transcriptional activator
VFGNVARERLFAALDAVRSKPLVWICGWPGAGKTVLASSYLEARSRPALWYQVDAGDADPATFFYYLSEAAASLQRGKKTRLPLLTQEYLADIPGFTRRFFRSLFAVLPIGGLLVLDNFQDAGDHEPFLDLVRSAVAEIPPHAQMMIISREPPGESFARMRADQSLCLFDGDELRLSADEAMLVAEPGTPLDRQALMRLHGMADGWAAGFVLLVEHARRADMHALPAAPGQASQSIFDYFASEVFATLGGPVRAVLLRAAFFPRFTAAAVSELSGGIDVRQLLDALHRRRLFIDKRVGNPPVYQFHPLLRDFLLARARQDLSVAERTEVAGRAALLMEQAQELEAAAALYAEATQWPALTRLVQDNAGQLLAQGRNQALDTLLALFPSTVIDQTPWLLFWRGMARLPFAPSDSRRLFEAAFALFKQVDDVAGQLLACARALDSYFFEWAGFEGADPWIREMEILVARHPDLISPEVEAQVIACGRTILFRDPTHPILADWAPRARAMLRAAARPQELTMMGEFLFIAELWRGNYPAIKELLRETRNTLGARHRPVVVDLSLRVWEIYCCSFGAGHANAHAGVESALQLSAEHGIQVYDGFLYGIGIFTALGQGDLDRAKQYVARMEASPIMAREMDRGYAHLLATGVKLVSGDMLSAQVKGRIAVAEAEASGAPWMVALNDATLAPICVELGDYESAHRHLLRLREFAVRMPALNLAFGALLTEANLLARSGDDAQARATLARALAMGREQGYLVTGPIWLPKVMSRLCAIALQHGIEPAYVERLIRKRNLAPPTAEVEPWPWPVKVYTLGRFSVVVDKVPLRSQGKTQRKTLELLQALIALGGRDVDAMALAQALWPDAEGDAAYHALETSAHRLRKLIGRDTIEMQSGRVTLDAQRCWVDAWALERTVGQLTGLLNQRADFDRIRPHLAQMQSLYKGPFLGQDSQPWLLAPRERLRGRYLRCLDAMAERFERGEQLHEALELLHQGIDLDPFAEAFYRRLMQSYQRLGRQAEALAVWRRCQRTLRAGLGINPSAQTEAIALALQR